MADNSKVMVPESKTHLLEAYKFGVSVLPDSEAAAEVRGEAIPIHKDLFKHEGFPLRLMDQNLDRALSVDEFLRPLRMVSLSEAVGIFADTITTFVRYGPGSHSKLERVERALTVLNELEARAPEHAYELYQLLAFEDSPLTPFVRDKLLDVRPQEDVRLVSENEGRITHLAIGLPAYGDVARWTVLTSLAEQRPDIQITALVPKKDLADFRRAARKRLAHPENIDWVAVDLDRRSSEAYPWMQDPLHVAESLDGSKTLYVNTQRGDRTHANPGSLVQSSYVLARHLGWDVLPLPFMVDGGNYLYDEAPLMGVEEVLLNTRSRDDIEREFRNALHAKDFAWEDVEGADPILHMTVNGAPFSHTPRLVEDPTPLFEEFLAPGDAEIEFVGNSDGEQAVFHIDMFTKDLPIVHPESGKPIHLVADLAQGRFITDFTNGFDRHDVEQAWNAMDPGRDYEHILSDYGLAKNGNREAMDDVTERRLDEHAAAMSEEYHVVRVPFYAKHQYLRTEDDHGKGIAIELSYTNALFEHYTDDSGAEVRRVTMPVYGFSALDEAAAKVYEDLGYEVTRVLVPISMPRNRGALRCAVKVLDRD